VAIRVRLLEETGTGHRKAVPATRLAMLTTLVTVLAFLFALLSVTGCGSRPTTELEADDDADFAASASDPASKSVEPSNDSTGESATGDAASGSAESAGDTGQASAAESTSQAQGDESSDDDQDSGSNGDRQDAGSNNASSANDGNDGQGGNSGHSDRNLSEDADPAVVETALAVEELLAGLVVAEEVLQGYSRDLFKHWIDADGDGCNTRFEVLIAESTVEVDIGPSCKLSGAWLSLYDGATTTDPGRFDVDHLVPLQEAWQSGAHAWSADTRARYANDLSNPAALIAVSASSNRSKGARDPAEWLPPSARTHCGYAWDWVLVKTVWSLTVDQAELDALTRILRGCEPGGLSGTQSTVDPGPAAPTATVSTVPSNTAASSTSTTTTATTTTTQPPSTTSAAASSTTTEAGTVPPNPGDSRNCSDFATQAEAQAWFDLHFPHYGDVAKLDRNRDGRACESLP